MTTLFTNVHIVDGTGAPGFDGWLMVEDDRIAAMDRVEATPLEAGETVDGGGAVLCPGFIDTHSHSDFALITDPDVPAKLHQGVTLEVLGQDGLALAPLPDEHIPAWRKNLAGLDGDDPAENWDWGDLSGYLKRLENGGVGPNAACLAAHGNLRLEALGLENRPATDDEIVRMQAILERELDAGAFGLSTGLIYIPCAFADGRELTALCRTAADRDVPLVIHQRSESGDILTSMEEVFQLARDTGVHIHFSHFKVCGKKYGHLLDEALAMLDRAQAEGIRVALDQYPYTAGSTMLSVVLPPWVHDGGASAMLERLAVPALREEIKRDIRSGLEGWDNFVDFAGEENIFITHVDDPDSAWAVGSSLEQLGQKLHGDPLDAAMDLLIANDNGVSIVDFYGEEEHVEAILARPETNVCTDGLLFGTPHPRAYGAFPRVLGRMARERSVLTLEEAVHKMTGMSAAVFGFEDRGVLRQGAFADLVLFDPDTVRDVGDYIKSRQFPTGIHRVYVNGRLTVLGDEDESPRSGRVLRRASHKRGGAA